MVTFNRAKNGKEMLFQTIYLEKTANFVDILSTTHVCKQINNRNDRKAFDISFAEFNVNIGRCSMLIDGDTIELEDFPYR